MLSSTTFTTPTTAHSHSVSNSKIYSSALSQLAGVSDLTLFCLSFLVAEEEEEEEEEKDFHKELVSMGLLKWRKGRPLAEAPRFIEKAPKIVNVMKVSPRAIQQPR